MKKLLLGLIILAFLVSPAQAQGPGDHQVYLPIIGGSNLPALLRITDGTASGTIDLLSPLYGYRVIDWTQDIPDLKAGGVWQDSPLASERNPAYGQFANATDRFTLLARDVDTDTLIGDVNLLWSLLEKGRRYWTDANSDEMVWIEARAPQETNTRYTIVKVGRIPDLPNPHAVPFVNPVNQTPAIEKLSVLIEHGPWLANEPGVDTCVQASGTQAGWNYVGWQTINNDRIHSLLQSTTGRIFSGELGNIDQSDDDGVTWALSTAAPVAEVEYLFQTATGRILGTENANTWKTDNDGVAWAAVTTPQAGDGWHVIQTTSGRLLMATQLDVMHSDDNGENWVASVSGVSSTIYSLLQTASGRILAGGLAGDLWYSTDDGDNWALLFSGFGGGYVQSLLQLPAPDGRILAGGTQDRIWASDDDGDTWSFLTYVSSSGTHIIYRMMLASNGRLYAEAWGVYSSPVTDLHTWRSDYQAGDEIRAIIETAADSIIAGNFFAGVGGLYRLGGGEAATVGRAATCADEVFVANKQNVAQLTNIYVDDGGAWSANLFPFAAFPTALLPAAPAVGDAAYFGINTTVGNSGPFESLVFDLSAVITYDNSYTVVWEYYNGAAWAALTVQDGTNPGSGAFRVFGVSSVHWTPPANWATRALNLDGGPAVTGYWVRARVSALAGNMTAPSQQNRDIYTAVLPYAEIAAAQVPGTFPMLARLRVHNRSDRDGRGGNAPDLWDNRIVAGLRSYDRGPTFTSNLNVSDEQNPAGVTVTLDAACAYSNNVAAITGRLCTYSAALGHTTFADRVTFTLGPTIARDFYGTFHAYLRASVTAGALGDIHARLQVRTGSGGVTFTSDDDWLKGTADYEVLDLGQVSIPASGDLNLSDLGDSTVLAVQFRNDSGAARTVYVHDLILIPCDEWAADSWDEANVTLSVIGRQSSMPHMLDLDSVRMPKKPNRATVRTADGSEFVTSIYTPGMVGPAILQANADQRLWFFAMRTSATGTSYAWLAEPWIAHSLRITGVARYAAMRGAE